MAEEMVLLERAKELDIKVSDSEAEKAIADIKGEYPDDVFEQMLLEYAVPYHSWEKGFKTRLLMEKVIAKELGKQIAITPAEISNYYHENYKDQSLTSDLKEMPEDISATIIKHLRRKKMEEAYKSWITKFQKKYAIEINKAQWEKIIGS
jgi:FKBP-type peptidyl-prolyl cis-trans isomerase (trigger factor)